MVVAKTTLATSLEQIMVSGYVIANTACDMCVCRTFDGYNATIFAYGQVYANFVFF